MKGYGYKISRLLKLAKNFSVLCSFTFFNFSTANDCDRNGPLALIGGQGSAPYAAFIDSDLSVSPLSGLPPTGVTFRVAINSSGQGLIGGTNGLDAYAALVSPSGTVRSIPGLIAPGEIYTVAINSSGRGIIGGGHLDTNVPYAALISPGGTATPLSALPASGLIYGVAIEESGRGIVGGIGPLNSAYAALVSRTGTVTPIAGLPANGGIFWVAVNDSGTRFIGGKDNTSVYAAFVTPHGSLAPISGLPPGLLYSVAINNAGAGIIGGSSSTLPYAALVAPNGSTTTISGLPSTAGIIYNTAINESGTGLIAGFSTTGPFGAFISPTGSLKPLKGLPNGPGFLDGAALHSSGIAFVGGTSSGEPFAALVAPNGHLTFLDGLPAEGEINSIGIAMLDGLVPKSIGPYDSWANTQFALSNTLTQHCMFHHRHDWQCCGCEQNSSIWVAPFGNYVREKGRQCIPSFSNEIAGVVLGFDYSWNRDLTIGAGLAYAYNDVHYSKHLGHATINQESVVLYASWERPCFYVNAALWGGLFQSSLKRNSLACITSKAKPNGWNLTPHLEAGTPLKFCACPNIIVEPFVAFDWANNWQVRYRENGASGFNIELDDIHATLLRSEVGCRFYQTLQYGWGLLLVEEKGSYVNRTSFHKGRHSASFKGACSSFDVETLSTKGQNHGLAELHFECVPSCLCDVYASFDYQGEFGSSFQSQTLSFTLGKNF